MSGVRAELRIDAHMCHVHTQGGILNTTEWHARSRGKNVILYRSTEILKYAVLVCQGFSHIMHVL